MAAVLADARVPGQPEPPRNLGGGADSCPGSLADLERHPPVRPPDPHRRGGVADVGAIDATWIDEDDPHVNPMGSKGMGEIGIVGTAAAIANAVYHATGIRVRDLPITLEKLLRRVRRLQEELVPPWPASGSVGDQVADRHFEGPTQAVQVERVDRLSR